MSLSEIRFLPISRGTLILLRQKAEMIERGKSVLEMRREQLVKEIFLISRKLKERASIEHEYIRALEDISRLRLLVGEVHFHSMVSLIVPSKIEILPTSIQGVTVPQARILEEPDLSKIYDPEFIRVFKRLWNAVRALIEIANLEVAVERLSEHLAYVNRIVNSLERSIIPMYKKYISYVEERIEEEMIEEFVKLKGLNEVNK